MERIPAVLENNGALLHLYDMLLAIKTKVLKYYRIGRLVLLWTLLLARALMTACAGTGFHSYFLLWDNFTSIWDQPLHFAVFMAILFRGLVDKFYFTEYFGKDMERYDHYLVYQKADGRRSFLLWFTWALQVFDLTMAPSPNNFLRYTFMVVSIISLFVPFLLTYENLMELYGEAPTVNVQVRRQNPAVVPLVWKSRFRELRLLHAGETPECLICRELYKFGDETCRLPTCKHRYHYACLKEWCNVRKVCPLCEARIPCVNKDAVARSKKQ